MAPQKLNDSMYSTLTRLIHGQSHSTEWDYSKHIIPPVSRSVSFRLDSAQRGAKGFGEIGNRIVGVDTEPPIYVYDRMGEPNVDLLQQGLALAEQGEVAVAFGSGMAAVSAAIFSVIQSGDHIISHNPVYGCTFSLYNNWLSKFNVDVTSTDLSDSKILQSLITPKTRLVYLESPANPTMSMLDLDAIVAIVNEANKSRSPDNKIYTAIDNTFATPFCQRPLTKGVDMVIHSLTKSISGFGVDMGGAVVTRKEFWQKLILYRKDFGAVLSSDSAWRIMVYGLATLPLRIPKQQENALKIAQFLESHSKVEYVRYPGLPSYPQYELAKRMLKDYDGNFAPGTMIYFALKGTPNESLERGSKMMDFIAKRSYAITLAVSLGQLRTLIEHPGSMTHIAYSAEEQMKNGMHPGGIRLAVGIESAEDIIQDLKAALE